MHNKSSSKWETQWESAYNMNESRKSHFTNGSTYILASYYSLDTGSYASQHHSTMHSVHLLHALNLYFLCLFLLLWVNILNKATVDGLNKARRSFHYNANVIFFCPVSSYFFFSFETFAQDLDLGSHSHILKQREMTIL